MKLDFDSPSAFQERLVPEGGRLAGMAALVHGLDVAAPVRQPCAVAAGHIRGSTREENGWTVYDKRYWPGQSVTDHLSFALRHEWFDPLVLKRIFELLPPADLAAFIRAAPSGATTRRAWFMYETLTGKRLDLEDISGVTAVDALNPERYFTASPRLSRRHRVRDNLLGTADYCPVIRRTQRLEDYAARQLADKAAATVGRTSTSLITRAASFLLLADSQASFEIEGERPPRDRLERWSRAMLQAGRNPLTRAELDRLLGILIEDRRFVHQGIRPDGVFLGERDRTGDPLPEFIGARPDDLSPLISGMLKSNERMRESQIDAVVQATATAFGFVYIHPYQDGNGRLHRYLIHHVLAERGYTPPGIVFPVSSVMLDRIDDYQKTLQNHSAPLMPFIEWHPTPERNVEVLNDTSDLYRYFDCTEEAEFLYACVARTVEKDLPEEIDYLQRHDEAQRRITQTVEMPDRLAQDLIMFIRQNKGRLPKRRREKQFETLTDDEVSRIEAIINEVFGDNNV